MRDKDKAEIIDAVVARTSSLVRELIQEELRLALVRTITIERGPRQQGDPEKVIKEEQWNVLDFLAAYAPKIEAALRGMQEDVDKTKNAVAVSAMKVEAVGKILLGLEQSALRLASFSDNVRTLELGQNGGMDNGGTDKPVLLVRG